MTTIKKAHLRRSQSEDLCTLAAIDFHCGVIRKDSYLVLLVAICFPWFWVALTAPCDIGVAGGKTQSVEQSSGHSNSDTNVQRDQLKV